MKRAFLFGLGLIALSAAPAVAADIPVKAPMVAPVVAPPYNWTGFYIGASGGGAWGRSRHSNSAGDLTPTFDISGGIVGGTVGYNAQFGQWVIGLEGDWSWTNKKGSAFDIPPFNTAFSSETHEDWIATGRGRIGYAFDRWMIYGTGGFAVADIGITVCPPAPAACAGETQTRWGWTAGGGFEFGIDPNWSVKAEYLYARFDNTSYFTPPPTATFANRTGGVFVENHIARIGINYRFNWGGPVIARY
jgi:outer membrane immunogenic protein